MGEFLSNLSTDQKGALVTQALKLAPAIISFGAGVKAREQQRDYLDDIKKLENNRQQVTNPYENLSNPYANLGVATKAAEMQAEQADIALANTLDSLRQTGGGGATALAQAALRSKQGVSASIQQQEAQNQRLMAQGERQREMAIAKGESIRFARQEQRDNIQLDRLQALADEAGARRQEGFGTGVDALTSMAGGMASALINPKATPLTIEEQMEMDKNKNISLKPRTGGNIKTSTNMPNANLKTQKVNIPAPSRSAQPISLPNTSRGLQGVGSEYGGVPMEGQVPFIQPRVNFIPSALQSFTPSNTPFNDPFSQMQGYDLGATSVDRI
mgnify:CR=1 FL=1|tara:strand:- start:704 stop:1690 length:987 start_codon:yes stop_codon:yes gene_type:complete